MEQYLSTSYKTIKKYILLSIYKSQSLNMVMSHYDISKESPYVYLYGLKFHACRPWCQNTRFSVLSSNFPSDNRFFIITSFSCCCSFFLFLGAIYCQGPYNRKKQYEGRMRDVSLLLLSDSPKQNFFCLSLHIHTLLLLHPTRPVNPYLLQSSVQTSTFC